MMHLVRGILGATLLAVVCVTAQAAERQECLTKERLLTQSTNLPVFRQLLVDKKPLTIVAIGSSSTSGQGATTPDNSYPSQLKKMLLEAQPDRDIAMINAGIGGQVAGEMLARFDKDVFSHRPSLVLWQVGANDAMRAIDPETFRAELQDGIDRLKQANIDVMILPPQFAPIIAAAPQLPIYLDVINSVAAASRIPVFRRYEIMRALTEPQLASMMTPDGLHMNDLGYHCLASQIAEALEATFVDQPMALAQ